VWKHLLIPKNEPEPVSESESESESDDEPNFDSKKDDNIFEFVVKDDNGSILCIKCKCCDNKLRIEINGKEVDVTKFFKTILSRLLFNILHHVINIST